MRSATERVSVAVAFKEITSGDRRLCGINVKLRRELGIQRLQRRVHQISAEHRVVPTLAKRKGDVTWRVTGRRQDAYMVTDYKVIAYNLGLPGR
jgi:hypothetical protein